MKNKKESKRYSNEDIKAFFEHIKDYFKSLYDEHEPLRITLFFILLYTVAFAVDSLDLPTMIIQKFGKELLCGVLCGLVLAILVLFIQKHWIDLLKEKTVNDIDRILIVSFIFNLSVLIYWLIKYGVSYCKVILLLGATLILFGLICCRIIITFNKNSNNSVLSNVYELQDILEHSVERKENIPILITEKAVDYDLFKRNDIINHICLSIKACYNAENSFVIGLDGPWGSGKTTLLNNVKKLLKTEKDIEIIDDFDLWTYNTQESLLFALLDKILSHTGVKYSYISTKKMMNEVSASIIGNNAIAGSVIGLLNNYNSNNVVSSLKKKIEKNLDANNKTILIIIDNIDRASADNILFLFKLIGNILDLKRVVYVLSYDSTRTKKILKDNLEIDENYIEKIIQQEISIPSINKESLNIVFDTSLKNLLLSYGVQKENIGEYQYIIDFIINNTKNIREFKRLINSAFAITFADDKLYKPDLLTLEIIRFLDNELYNYVKTNLLKFVSYDIPLSDDSFFEAFNKETAEENKKKFFDKLFEQHDEQFAEFLGHVFSILRNYCIEDKHLIKSNDDNEHKIISLNCKADSYNYVDLYFSYGNNVFTEVDSLYKKFFNYIKSHNNEVIISFVNEQFEEMSISYHEEFIKKLWFNRYDFTPEQSYYLFIGLLNNIYIINAHGTNSISPYYRTTGIMATFFSVLNENQQKEIANDFKNKYIHIELLQDIIIRYPQKDSNGRDILKATSDSMCETILSNGIDIYSSENYKKFNIFALINYKSNENGKFEIKDYIRKIIKPQYIYKMLLECISVYSEGNEHVYIINADSFNWLFESTDIVNECIEQYKPTNKKEQFILDVYNTFINPVSQDVHYNGLKTDEYIEL